MSVKLSMFGQALDGGHELALANVRPVVEAAAAIGTTVTLDAEDHTTLDSMFAIHEELRKTHPETGCVIQAYLFRTEADARRLAAAGSRVRLVKGAYKEPAEVALQQKHEIDKAYVRVLRILMEGEGYPMIGSHDPRLISIGQELAHQAGRKLDEYEFQMLYGIRGEEHLRLAASGSRVRLVKGAYKEPAEVAHQQKQEIDKAYVRVLRTLMEGDGYPMIGSHDPRLISIAQELARKAGRKLDEYEFQMLYGIRSDEHLRLAAEGHRMRVYTAYGTDWYGYFMRRLAEKPANLRFFLRSMVSKG
jgi:proline dehydrogenase